MGNELDKIETLDDLIHEARQHPYWAPHLHGNALTVYNAIKAPTLAAFWTFVAANDPRIPVGDETGFLSMLALNYVHQKRLMGSRRPVAALVDHWLTQLDLVGDGWWAQNPDARDRRQGQS
jgi:hypothetical protein